MMEPNPLKKFGGKALHGATLQSPQSGFTVEPCSSNGEKPNLLSEGAIRLLFDLFAIFLPTRGKPGWKYQRA